MTSSPQIPTTMKAWTYSRTGHHSQVLSLNSIPTPKPTGDQVLIKVAYSGFNAGDVSVMEEVPNILRAKTQVPAADYSGTIVALGPKAPANLKVGMKVFGMVDLVAMFTGTGTLAEYVCLSVGKNMVAPLPENVALGDAGGLAISGLMAYQTVKKGDIRPDCGLRILINGASGGCGSAFLQAAKALGAKEIVATCSKPNFSLVSSLGADRVIDYREHTPLSTYLAEEFGDQPFDLIYDSVGAQELYTNSPKYLKKDGVFLNIGAFVHGRFLSLWYWFANAWWPTWLGGTSRRYMMFRGTTDTEAIEWVVRFVAEGKIKPVIDRIMGFDEAHEALDIVGSKRARGRVLVKVADN